MGLKILIPIDWSDNANKAFCYFVDNLLQRDSIVYLTHNIVAENEDDLRRKRLSLSPLQEEYENKLLDMGANFEWIVGTGKHPGEHIVRASREKTVDLIVMGARGLGKIQKAILGSVSDYVMKKAKVPVLICKWPSD